MDRHNVMGKISFFLLRHAKKKYCNYKYRYITRAILYKGDLINYFGRIIIFRSSSMVVYRYRRAKFQSLGEICHI